MSNGSSDPQPVQFGPGALAGSVFFDQWRQWLNGNVNGVLEDYFDRYAFPGPGGPPANFYDLSVYGPPSDEFVFNSERNMISRILADSDGDGFTDSFWFIVPPQPDSDLRQVVAVSITDNSGRVNMNTATVFDRQNTVGASPADVALVGDYLWNEAAAGPTRTNNIEQVGFLDNPRNAESWDTINPLNAPGDPTSLYGLTASQYDRRDVGRQLQSHRQQPAGKLPRVDRRAPLRVHSQSQPAGVRSPAFRAVA